MGMEEEFVTVTKAGTSYCCFPQCNSKGMWYRQRTMYNNDNANWACYCAQHRIENDDYWDEMWNDYYSGLL
jgi:hypothetical protein